MKRLLSLTMIVAMVAFAIVSCKDDFNEEEYLRLQYELKQKQAEFDKAMADSTSEDAIKTLINAANEAGDLLSVSLIVRENGNALQGATVSLSSGVTNELSSGRTQAVTTRVTDASGSVVFDRVTIGKGTATISKTGYVTATATYDFGQPAPPTQIQIPNPNGNGNIIRYVPPVKRFENGVLPMFSATASEGSTATISGKVTIENDLTNLTPEVPAGIVLRANLTSLVSANQGIFTSYTLSDNSTLGRATINPDGTYTMQVPATAAGSSINFIIPNIDGTCRMAVNGYDNGTGNAIALAVPEYKNVPTSWGPNVGTSGGIPIVPGARIVVPSAPAAGSGLSFTLSPVSSSLESGTINSNTESDLGNTIYRVTNRGSFSASATTPPTVTIGGGGGTGATATATLQALVTSISVTGQGSGLDAFVDLNLMATLQGGGSVSISKIAAIPTTGGLFPATFNVNSFTSNNGGFGNDENATALASDVTNLFLEVSGNGSKPTLTSTIVVDLRSVTINQTGSGYTSKPTFSFDSGGAAIEVLEFPVFWDITPVMGAGTDYAVLPTLVINFPQSYSTTGTTSQNVNTFNPNGSVDANNQSLISQLTISGGDIVKKFPTRSFRTMSRSEAQPSITITNVVPLDAKFTFDLTDFNPTTGAIIGQPTVNSFGTGYNTKLTGQIVPTIAGAPGSGGTIRFDYIGADYNTTTMEWQFAGPMGLPSPGSGYLPNLNQRDFQLQSLPANQTVQAGKTYTVNFEFGSGQRRTAVN